MTFKFSTFLLCLLAVTTPNLWLTAANAQSVEDYTVNIVVANESDEARNTALRDALKIVLRRVVGKDANDKRATSVLDNAQALVKQYSYGTTAKDETQLSVLFDQALVEKELRDLDLPVWGNAGASVNTISIRVTGIRTPQAYAKLLSTLRGVGGIKHVVISEVGEGVVHLRVQSDNVANKLAQSLVSSKSFRRTDLGEDMELAFTLLN